MQLLKNLQKSSTPSRLNAETSNKSELGNHELIAFICRLPFQQLVNSGYPGLLLRANPVHGFNQPWVRTTLTILSLTSCRSGPPTKCKVFGYSRLQMAMQTDQPGTQGLNYSETCYMAAGLSMSLPGRHTGLAGWQTMCCLSTCRSWATHTSTDHATLLCVCDTSVTEQEQYLCESWRCDGSDTSKREEPCRYSSVSYIINTRARNVHPFCEE